MFLSNLIAGVTTKGHGVVASVEAIKYEGAGVTRAGQHELCVTYTLWGPQGPRPLSCCVCVSGFGPRPPGPAARTALTEGGWKDYTPRAHALTHFQKPKPREAQTTNQFEEWTRPKPLQKHDLRAPLEGSYNLY